MMRSIAVVALLFAGVVTGQSHVRRAGDEGVFYGPLVRVKDGDSLVVKVQGVAMDVRLAGIDAPELDQPYGREAKQALVSLASGGQLVVEPLDTDRYGRTVAHVWNGEMQLNKEMVKRGGAWFYSEFARSETLYEVEQEARNAKRGLWALALKDRVEPWVWRERRRTRN
jgi:endonuclease YncB( thermonuclease family)